MSWTRRQVVRTKKMAEECTLRACPTQQSGTRLMDFCRLPMVSLTLFFSSLLPCILHVCLYIWSTSPDDDEAPTGAIRHSMLNAKLGLVTIARLSQWVPPSWGTQWADTWDALASTLQREGVDEMWIVVRLLAGMSSSFGLRGMFPLHFVAIPVETERVLLRRG
jgi:hypothetical protein